MLELTSSEWCLALLGALGLGVSKSGFAGLGLFHVVVFATLFEAKPSTGIVLPMLLFGDMCAVASYRRHANWTYITRMSLPTGVGVVAGWLLMQRLDESTYRLVIGGIILCLAVMQALRMWRNDLFSRVPHSNWFCWSLALVAGFTTMLANGGGVIIALYLVTVAMPKLELVGTAAWFFLLLNLFKIPFSVSLGLINLDTLTLNAILVPAILVGLFVGRWLIHRVPQRLFDSLVLAFSATAALRLMGFF